MNRDQLEQEAMNLLRRGQSEKALEKYLAILRQDAKDRRIRQKVADLYLSLGRKPEAARHLQDVAKSMVAAGQLRQAASVYVQLVDLKPDEHELRADLAGCLTELGRKSEARVAWEEAFRLVERREVKAAIEYARNVARLAPGEVPPKVRVAELLENNRREDDAFAEWVRLGDEARRFGRPDDQARFLERALKLRPDDMDTLLDAADARIKQGEVRQALVHLQHAYGLDPRHVRLLTLLGRGLQALGQLPKARKVWLQAARRQAELGNREAQVDALRHAMECGEPDAALQDELERADAEAARQRVRLHDLDWAQPTTDAEVRCLVRARTERRYGFPDRARATLEQADPVVKAGVAWAVHYGELLVSTGAQDQGVRVLAGVRPPSEGATRDLAQRLEVLGTHGLARPAPEPAEELVDDEDTAPDQVAAPGEPAEPPDDEPAPAGDPREAEARGDALAADGDSEAAIAAYREALAFEPGNVDILRKIGEVLSEAAARARGQARKPRTEDHSAPIPLAIPEPDLEGLDFGSAFSEVDPDEMESIDDAIGDARALVEIGQYEEAMDRLRGQDDLEALVVQAIAARALGRLDGAQGRLERAVQAGNEHHPAYVEALWELAGVYLLRKKLGNAERILDEVAVVDPGWRPVELAARRRGIEILRQR